MAEQFSHHDIPLPLRGEGQGGGSMKDWAKQIHPTPTPGKASRVRVVRTDRQANVAVHQRLYAAVAEALAEL